MEGVRLLWLVSSLSVPDQGTSSLHFILKSQEQRTQLKGLSLCRVGSNHPMGIYEGREGGVRKRWGGVRKGRVFII